MNFMTLQWSADVTILFDVWNTNGNYFLYFVSCAIIFFSSMMYGICSINLELYEISDPDSLSAFHIGISYLLMLVAMTYNNGLLISIFLGIFVGNFAFRLIFFPTELKRILTKSNNAGKQLIIQSGDNNNVEIVEENNTPHCHHHDKGEDD